MVFREEDKHFLSSLYIAVAIILTWKGLWTGIYEVPFIGSLQCKILGPYCGSFVFLFIGFAMLMFSGAIFKEFDPLGGIQKAVNKTLHSIYTHQDKKNFQFKYYDKSQKKNVAIPAAWVKKIEKDALIVVLPHQKKEIFIPIHRVTEVLYKGKSYWRL
ncbi:MAG: RNA repair domain-containing protein [Nanoarchaeota archaeon]